LKEALDELNSAQMIITILQKELLSYNIPTTTCEVNLSPTVESQSKLNAEEWINTAHKNVKLEKHQKHIRNELASSSNYVSTKNRFSPLSNLERTECASPQRATKHMKQQTKGKKIPSIVNGILDYHNDFPNLTHKQEGIVCVSAKCHQKKKRTPQFKKISNSAKHKVLIIGDSHARNCANLLQDNLSTDLKSPVL
jgi:hypothetical protein